MDSDDERYSDYEEQLEWSFDNAAKDHNSKFRSIYLRYLKYMNPSLNCKIETNISDGK